MTSERFLGYTVRRERWAIAGEAFELIWPADMDAVLDDPRTRARFARDEFMPYWAVPWPASILLAEYVLTTARRQGGCAIELACGIGLVSIAAARAGWEVTATDRSPEALRFTRYNARVNGVRLSGVRRTDWRCSWRGPRFDLVLASDVLFERRNIAPVVGWLRSALAPGGVVLLSDPDRGSAEGFRAAAESEGFRVERFPREVVGPNDLPVRGTVYRLTAARDSIEAAGAGG